MDRLGGFWWIVFPAWLWAALLLWASSGGFIGVIEWMAFVMLAAPIASAWCISTALQTKLLTSRVRQVWLSAPIVWALAFSLSVTDLPLIARFHFSEHALRRHAERGPLETSRDKNTRVIGLFRVAEVWRHGRTVAFTTDASKIFGHVGVIYAPDGLPTELPMEVEELLWARYTHINGPWYRFETGD